MPGKRREAGYRTMGLAGLIFSHTKGQRRPSTSRRVSKANEMFSDVDVLSTCDSFIMTVAALATKHANALTPRESRIASTCNAPRPSCSGLAEARDLIRADHDPLGTAYYRVYSAGLQHPLGRTCTS